LIIPSILWISYNNAANWHFHQLEFGLLTSHSHAYDKSCNAGSPIKDHEHDNKELLYLDQVFHALMVWFFTSLILLIVKPPRNILAILSSEMEAEAGPVIIHNVRGPPNGFVLNEAN